VTGVFTLLLILVARCHVTLGTETSQELQKALFIQNSSWQDEDSSSHRQLHLRQGNEVRKLWGTCVSSSWYKAEGAPILAIGGQMMRVGPFSEAKDWGSGHRIVWFSWTRASGSSGIIEEE
jgi:hypothetical protein